MKKIAAILMMMVLMAAGRPALAADAAYAVDELHLRLQAPQEWVALSRDVDESHPMLAQFSTTADALRTFYKERNIYLNLFPDNFGYELLVVMTQDAHTQRIFNYNMLSRDELVEVVERFMASDEAASDTATFLDYDFYAANDVQYVVYNVTQHHSGQSMQSRIFNTFYNGMSISVTLNITNSQYAEEAIAAQSAVIDSLVFTQQLEQPGVIGRILSRLGIPLPILYAALGVAVGCVAAVVIVLARGRKKNKAAAPPDAGNPTP